MDIVKFLIELSRHKIQVWADDDKLRVRSPKGGITPEIHQTLTTHKVEILAFLQAYNQTNNLPASISPLSSTEQDLLIQQLQLKIPREVNTNKFSEKPKFISIDLESEAILDNTIQPLSVPGEFNPNPNHIFLTGSTGFLGAFLLQELLVKTSAKIFCLVRGKDKIDGKKRIKQNLKNYSIWQNNFNSRIIPVLGNLSQPLFGLSAIEFQALASTIDVIYHSAAFLNFAFPYQALKPINVLGTQEVLRLACTDKLKTFHHISSFSVLESDNYNGQIVKETDYLNYSQGMYLGYAQSKWVAEKMVINARSQGLPTCIYRLPFISGHSFTGVWNTKDFTCLMLKCFIEMGIAPDLTDGLQDNNMLTITPVDYLSQAIVYLSRQKVSNGKTFHLNNPYPLDLRQLNYQAKTMGFPINYITFDVWQNQLEKTVNSPEHLLFTLKPFFLEKITDKQVTIAEIYCNSNLPKIDNTATRQALAKTGIICPPITWGLMANYYLYFLYSGFMDTKYFPWQTVVWLHYLAIIYRIRHIIQRFLARFII